MTVHADVSAVVQQRLRELVRAQYAANAHLTPQGLLAWDADHADYALRPEVVAFIAEEHETLLLALDEELADLPRSSRDGLIALFVWHTLGGLYSSNQFLQVAPAQRRELVTLYATYLARLRDVAAQTPEDPGDLASPLLRVVSEHLSRLRAFLLRLADGYDVALVTATASCAEYSPELQLELLGVDPVALREPVLDIGCGSEAALVRWLRERGVSAYGIDRMAPREAHIQPADWLTFTYKPDHWGTVLSHLAFSHHFRFHHAYAKGTPELYASAYMRILRSLRPGGSFYYAPDLPFLEPLLSRDSYRIERRAIPSAGPTADGAFAATRVVRLGA